MIHAAPTHYGSELVAAGMAVLVILALAPRLWRRWLRPDIHLRSADWGKVYVLQDVRTPTLIKVGLTRRTAFIRSAEVSRDMAGGRELRRVFVIHMPYAAAVEAEALRLLARHRHRSERGQEWFRLRSSRLAIEAVSRAAFTIRRVARLRRRWSREAEQDVTAHYGSESTQPVFLLCSHARRRHGRARRTRT